MNVLRGRPLAAAFHRNRWELLVAGMTLNVLALGWPGIDVLSWFAPIPWLHFLRHNAQPRQGVNLAAAWVLSCLMAAGLSPEVPMGPGSFLITTGTTLAGLLAWGTAVRRLAPNEGLISFGLAMAAVAVAQDSLGHVGLADRLAATGVIEFERLRDAFGTPALAFVVHWTAATIEGQWDTVYPSSMQNHGLAVVGVLVLLLVVGALSDGSPTAFANGGVAASATAIGLGGTIVVGLERQRRRFWDRARSHGPVDLW